MIIRGQSQATRRSGLQYEAAFSILGGGICWISGPWKPGTGTHNDRDIFVMDL